MKTETLEMTAENFQTLIKENQELKKENEKLQIDINGLEDEISDLKDESDDTNGLKETLSLFADVSNWNGNVWNPSAAHIERDYPDMIASKTLERCAV